MNGKILNIIEILHLKKQKEYVIIFYYLMQIWNYKLNKNMNYLKMD